VAEQYSGKKVWYGRSGSGADFEYLKVQQDKQGLRLCIIERSSGIEWQVISPMLGLFQSENITGCFAMARSIGISAESIISSVASFKGLHRRLEKRYVGKVTVFDDIAHSPEKARATLSTLRSVYDGEIICVFEPNIGGRSPESAPKYDNAFIDADIVVIPRLTNLKKKEDSQVSSQSSSQSSTQAQNPVPEVFDADALAEVISKTHREVGVIVEDDALVDFLLENAQDGDVIAFLGSHGFRNMIEETVRRFTSPDPQYPS
jgi:UDP-N-acetylmuramate-alanine ligase